MGESGGQVLVSNGLLGCPLMPDLLHNITLGSPRIPLVPLGFPLGSLGYMYIIPQTALALEGFLLRL